MHNQFNVRLWKIIKIAIYAPRINLIGCMYTGCRSNILSFLVANTWWVSIKRNPAGRSLPRAWDTMILSGEVKNLFFYNVMAHKGPAFFALKTFAILSNLRNQWGLSKVRRLRLWLSLSSYIIQQYDNFNLLKCYGINVLGKYSCLINLTCTVVNRLIKWWDVVNTFTFFVLYTFVGLMKEGRIPKDILYGELTANAILGVPSYATELCANGTWRNWVLTWINGKNWPLPLQV